MDSVVHGKPAGISVRALCKALCLPAATYYRRRAALAPASTTPTERTIEPSATGALLVVAVCGQDEQGATAPAGNVGQGAVSSPARNGVEPMGTAPKKGRPSPRALSADERTEVLAALDDDCFCNLAPAEVFATLLDEGRYICSERTMYRILASNAQVRERRNQLRHPQYTAPELMATGPNQTWTKVVQGWEMPKATMSPTARGLSTGSARWQCWSLRRVTVWPGPIGSMLAALAAREGRSHFNGCGRRELRKCPACRRSEWLSSAPAATGRRPTPRERR